MAKEIILYNLADGVTDEQYQDFVKKEKGPTIDSLPSVKKYELVRITGSASGEIPFNYVGIVHVKNMDEFLNRDKQTQKFQDLMAKLGPMLKDPHLLYGEEVY
jgi:hypothetical protein